MELSCGRLLLSPMQGRVAVSAAAVFALCPFGGCSTLDWALHYLSVTYVAIITLAEPIGLGILAFILMGEMIAEPAAIGAILVLAGIYVASRDEMGSQAFTAYRTT